jgi:predicted kinase
MFLNWYKVAQEEKIMYLLRGVPGAGKSTAVKSLPNVKPENIFSTDDLIGKTPEEYDSFLNKINQTQDETPLIEKHKQNQQRAEEAMKSGVAPIVIDNTNIVKSHAKPYVELAVKYGYSVKIVDVGTGGLSAEELAKRNKHNVPVDVIEKNIEQYKENNPFTVEEILK